MKKLSILFAAGARPNFMKIAPLMEEARRHKQIQSTLVHTGQHYDEKMSKVFFHDLGIPAPDVNLEVGAGTPAEQTGKIMIAFDAVLQSHKPDLVVVVGDVNSTVACSLAAAKRSIKVAHIEAGLRSFDWTMPEEINRIVTDRLSDFLFCTEPSALKNLKREGVAKEKIFFTGNVMIDTLMKHKKQAQSSKILEQLKISPGTPYALATLHRAANVDDPKNLTQLLNILQAVSRKGLKVIFPVHPRTKNNIQKCGIKTHDIQLCEPLGYLDFLKLQVDATMVLTDSGGVQEETTALGVPCLTLRENTERPVTITSGTNQLVGMDKKKILGAVDRILKKPWRKGKIPLHWDGKASQRIIAILLKHLSI